MAFTVVDLEGVTVTTPGTGDDFEDDLTDATTGNDVFVHVTFANPAVVLTGTGDFEVVEFTSGPSYADAMLHATLAAEPDLAITWTGSSAYAYHVLAASGLDGDEPIAGALTVPSLGSAVLGKMDDLPASVHMLCFAGSVNLHRSISAAVRPDVGWLQTLDLENSETAGMPVVWIGQFNGPLGDTDMSLNAAAYFDPAPSHSVGHVLALAVS